MDEKRPPAPKSELGPSDRLPASPSHPAHTLPLSAKPIAPLIQDALERSAVSRGHDDRVDPHLRGVIADAAIRGAVQDLGKTKAPSPAIDGILLTFNVAVEHPFPSMVTDVRAGALAERNPELYACVCEGERWKAIPEDQQATFRNYLERMKNPAAVSVSEASDHISWIEGLRTTDATKVMLLTPMAALGKELSGVRGLAAAAIGKIDPNAERGITGSFLEPPF